MKLFQKIFKSNKNTEKSKEDRFSYVTEFRDGYALAIDWLGDVVVINDSYEVVLYPNRYSECGNKEKWLGGYIILCDYEAPTHEGYVIGDSNLKVVKGGYHYVRIFKEGGDEWFEISIVDDKEVWCQGALNKNLETIIEPKFGTVEHIGNHELCGSTPEMSAIYNFATGKKAEVEGKIIESTIYEGKEYYKFRKNEKYGYYNDKFEIVIKPDNDALDGIDKKGNIPFVEGGNTGVINVKTGMKKFW